ncbi:SMI1/KNR4 family protein [Variovorax paradoxus]|uniref:SMI1/KNR4 family protein n=1 Tax=Variovorax paradoxus TaxID=34073 RepID=UPI0029C64963|nr:SMI1/KNR4 family protein [Variovorax paradoxus]
MNIFTSTRLAALLKQGDCYGSVPEELISEVEHRHGLVFPSEYRAFLLKFGAALMSGWEVFGLVPSTTDGEAPTWCDIRPLLQRPAPGVPSGWVPISDDGMDSQFYLACAPGDGQGEVFVLGPDADGIRVSPSFFTFLNQATSLGLASLIPQRASS